MKAKRIVSILLTGSMLLSLLPVSALAAAPVFDAPAQTTAKKAAPLVQEADASRSTEEEAATRSSRDLDAENGTAESFTIQLNAAGKPAGGGDYDHWLYYPDYYRLTLNKGTFTLQPSSEAGAKSALQADLYIDTDAKFNSGTIGYETYNYGTISDGTFQGSVYNRYKDISGGTFQGYVDNIGTISDGTFLGEVNNDYRYDDAASKHITGVISGGTFQGEVYNHGNISDGTFQGEVYNVRGTISGGTFREAVEVYASSRREATIEGGTFEKSMTLMNDYAPLTIKDGLFDGAVSIKGCNSPLSISGGLFTKAVDVSNISPDKLSITGGYFVNEPTVPEGSDISFTSVSDRNYRAFKVPVNGDWSKNGYSSLYIPHGSSEQPNTITVETPTKLTDCLADGETIMNSVVSKGGNTYEIPVRNYEKLVLVTEEHSAPPTDGSDSELDPDFSSGAAALGVVLATAGFGSIAYIYGTSVYLYYAMPDGFIPSTRQELANVLWTTAGKPDPVSTALYTDIPADNIEQQKAARWCVEQGLMSDYGETFGPDTKVTNARIIRAWNRLKRLPVTITK